MSDTELALALDACLWITPSGEARGNFVNLRAVKDRIEEGEEAFGALKDLADTPLPSRLWQGQAQVAQTLLEALLVVREQSVPQPTTKCKHRSGCSTRAVFVYAP